MWSLLEAVGQDDGCVTRGAVVGGEVGRGGLCCHSRIGLVWKSVGDTVVCFCMPAQTKGAEYSVGGSGSGGGETGS